MTENKVATNISINKKSLDFLKELVDMGIASNRSDAIRFCIGLTMLMMKGKFDVYVGPRCPDCDGPLSQQNHVLTCARCGQKWRLKRIR